MSEDRVESKLQKYKLGDNVIILADHKAVEATVISACFNLSNSSLPAISNHRTVALSNLSITYLLVLNSGRQEQRLEAYIYWNKKELIEKL